MSSLRSLTFASLAVTFFAGIALSGCAADVTEDPGTDPSSLAVVPCKINDTQECTTESGQPGLEYCYADDNGEHVWSPCSPSEGSTPLVLVFDDAPVTFAASSASFDLSERSSAVTDWPSAHTPWLAMDRDGNGRIDGGGELFGSATVQPDGSRAVNGFVALRELDSNHDGVLDASDAGWSKLLVWADADGDRASAASELESAASRKLVSIDLAYHDDARCDARGNCEIERARFSYLDASGATKTGTVVDVHLEFQ